MKLNLEIEIDWIDEESNLDETIKKNIIDSIVSRIEKKISETVTEKVNNIVDNTVVDKINTLTEKIFNGFMDKEISLTDTYGSKIKFYPNVYALIKERFDNFMEENVDDKGRTNTSSYGTKFKRINWIIDEQLKQFADKFTTDAVKKVSEEIKLHVKEGLTTKLGAQLMDVLKVNEMLALPSDKKK